MELIFNESGVPVLGVGTTAIVKTIDAPINLTQKGVSDPAKPLAYNLTVEGQEISNWGPGNNFPQIADDLIGSIGVLNTGLRFIRNVILGQGIFPCQVTGYDADGNEILKMIEDSKIRNFLSSRMVRRYMEKAIRDFLKFGTAFPEFIPANDGSLAGINAVNSLYSRYTIRSAGGEIENCFISGRWPELPVDKSEYKIVPVLSEYDPEEDLNRLRLDKKITKSTIIYPLRDSWSNRDYYSAPAWWPVKEAGWLEVAKVIPLFLKKAYENQITWKWHVKIPYNWFDRKFPETDYKTKDLRQAAITAFLDSFERNLTAPENASKALFTMFEIGPGGKAEEQWIIEALDNKYKDADQLITSAAANSEILFSLMINPNVLGAGMPGGTYAGNQGGSNIREAFLVNIANSWPERQTLLDPIEAFLRFNGAKDIELRFRNTILTTLDTGAGTKKILS